MTVLTAVTKWLEAAGFEVVALSKSLGATRTIMQVRPTLLLLDIKLPCLSGDRLAMVLSQNPATASIPVIFYSQIAPDELKRLAQECAVVGAISKTGDRGAFLREFEKLVAPFVRAPRPASAPSPVSLRIVPDLPPMGNTEVDEQHRRIMEMLRHITELIREGQAATVKPSVRKELKESTLNLLVFTRFHLATEDRLMRELHDPMIEAHRAEHAKFLDAATEIERKIAADPTPLHVIDAARELRRLILEHTDADLKGPVT